MNTNQNHVLLDHLFDPTEAGELLTPLFKEKINYLNLKNYTSTIRQDITDYKALNQIAALKESKKEIFDLIEEARKNGQKLSIKTEIKITVE